MASGVAIATDTFGRFERLAFVTRRPARAGLGGEHRSRRRAPSTDFADYRPYQPGDDFRRVDWNVYGRLGSLHVKLTEARERVDVTLVLDCSASMAWGQPDKLGFSARLVAALGYVALARSDAVRVVCLREGQAPAVLGPLHGRARLAEMVRFVSQVRGTGRVELNTGLGESVPTDAGQPLVVVVSDLLAPSGIADGLDGLLVQRADVVVLHVLSPDEHNPRLSGEVELIDSETGEVLELGASLATLAAYRERYARWLDEQASACSSRGVRYVRLSTDVPMTSVMLDELRRAHVLR